ncbi:MAG: Gp138 family membrane-puncturing spike protein [Janthinobacterium lividum]
MPDLRELFDSGPEEAFRASFAGLQKHLHTSMVSQVTENSDGKTLVAQPTIKQQVLDPTLTETTYADYPVLPDVPVHYPGGAGMTLTHGIAKGDEILTIFASRAHDTWFQSGGTQQPITDRTHSLSDGIAIPGLRSMPRALQQIDTQAAHLRSDDKLHLHEVHPTQGVRSFSADPSTPAASPTFDPLTMATKFIDHIAQAAKGVLGRAVDGATEHTHGVDHGTGAFMSAMASGGTNFVRAHPVLGSLISALDGKHSVTATLGGVMLQSATAISFDCPPGGLGLPAGSVGGSSLGSGAASSNVGALSGDLSGTLPTPQVVGLGHVDAHLLPVATSDAAAAALTPPVPIGGLYRDTSIASGKSVLVVRMA